jgi:5'-deoxynucleotidase YfbR-like HD superfamily hydrolase
LVHALTHDLGEAVIGDMARPVKDELPDVYQRLGELEARAIARMGFDPAPDILPYENELLAFCDAFDAYLWAAFHRPDYVSRQSDWRAMIDWLCYEAERLGVRRKFNEILKGVCDGKF